MLRETSETWDVDLSGRKVLMFTIDYRVTLHFHSEANHDGSLVLETPFDVRSPEGEAAHVVPGRPAELAPVLACFEKVVDAIAISRIDGSLFLTFTDGTRIEAAADADYEAWDLGAPGLQIVALPGGGEPALFRQKAADDPAA